MSKRRFALWGFLYFLLICYASTIVGPAGLHFVPLAPGEALRRFMAIRYMPTGSDQRADWMGNLMMLVPLGFLLTGSLWPRVAGIKRLAAVSGACALAFVLVLVVKYAQLYFPPRTVTLNYVLAQVLGSVIGVTLFWAVHGGWAMAGGGTRDRRLLVILRAYTAALVVFLLMPLDFALSAPDLMTQLERLPQVIMAVPDSGRPLVVQAALIAAGTLALLPVGMLLMISGDGRVTANRSVAMATWRGFWLVLGVFALSVLVISAAPSLLLVFYRTVGVALGALTLRWLARQDLNRIRRALAGAVPYLTVPYLMLVLAVNGVLSLHWLAPSDAISSAYPLGLMPLFDYYIVTKAEAAKNIVAHLVMYAPIGAMAWLCGRRAAAAPVAFGLAFCIELARYLRPGLEGDVNAVLLAGLSAGLTAAAMPSVWELLESVALPQPFAPGPGVIGWRERAAAVHARARMGAHLNSSTDIEHY